MESSIRIAAFLSLSTPALAQAELDAARLVLQDADSEILGVADFDGDGRADLFVMQGGAAPSFRIHYRQQGEFLVGASIALPPPPSIRVGTRFALFGDLNGDRLPEVVLDREDYQTDVHGVLVYRNVGGTLGAPVFVATGDAPYAGVLADREGDGRLDLGLLQWDEFLLPNRVSWWSPSGATLVSGGSATLDVSASTLAAADVTGDGRLDLIAGGEGGSSVYVFATRSNGVPDVPTPLALGASPAFGRAVQTGDLDGDGDEDLLVSWIATFPSTSTPLRVLAVENRGGVLVPGAEQSFAVDPSAYTYYGRGYLTDWDGDGDLDFLAPGRTLALLENRGARRFALAGAVPLLTGSIGILAGGVGDLDEDGRPDFAAGGVIYSGLGRLASPASDIPSFARFADLDDDGDLDALDGETTWINDGAGDFHEESWRVPTLAHGIQEDVVACDDFDGDGRRDLVVSRRRLQPTFSFLGTFLLRGTASGEFAAGIAAADPDVDLGSRVSLALAAQDLDGDGDLDLPALGGWWENDGAGRFLALHDSWLSLPLAAADADGDGDVDLLTFVVSWQTTSIRLQRNAGGGVFASELLATEATPQELSQGATFVDLDSDGDLDVVCGTTAPSPRVVVLENTGAVYAAPRALLGEGFAQERLAFDDLDGDGRLDVLGLADGGHGPTGSAFLVWHQAAGALAFDSPQRYFGLPVTAAADIDQDGDLDLVGARTVRGRRFEGPGDGLARQFGEGTPGRGGLRPVLGASGPFRPGSSTAALHLRRGAGGALAVLHFGAWPANPTPPTGVVHPLRPPRLPFVVLPLSGAPGAAGEGAADVSLTPLTQLHAGAHLWLQAFVLEPALPGGVSATNGLELFLGR